MNKEQSIEKIKSTLNELKELALSIKGKKEMKFGEYPTNEGPVLITQGELEIGAEVLTKDSEGNQTPVNDGEYTCEGKKITITGGKIEKMEEIKESDEIVSPEDNANVNVDMEKDEEKKDEIGIDVSKPLENGDEAEVEVPEPDEEIEMEDNGMEDRLKNLEDAVAKILSIMDQMMTKTEKSMSENLELEKKVAELSAQPGDEPVEVKLKRAPQTLNDVELRIERFRKMAQSL
jgi:hypothetical protein